MSETIYPGHGSERLQVGASSTSGEVTDLTRTPELTGGMVLSSSSGGAGSSGGSSIRRTGEWQLLSCFFKEKAIWLVNLEPIEQQREAQAAHFGECVLFTIYCLQTVFFFASWS